MPRTKGKAYKGSQKWMQILVNKRQNLLTEAVSVCLPNSPTAIDWRSPLESENYKEHRDRDFLIKLGKSQYLNNSLPSWSNLYGFWPRQGPCWDTHGVTDKGQILIGEAKSHTEEMLGKGSGAKSLKSIEKIARSLKETQQFLGCVPTVDWAKSPYFQHANRIAHLYWFHKLNGLDAYLVLLYFLNDIAMEANNTTVPKSAEEWEPARICQNKDLGIPEKHPLSDRIIHVFIDVNDIESQL